MFAVGSILEMKNEREREREKKNREKEKRACVYPIELFFDHFQIFPQGGGAGQG